MERVRQFVGERDWTSRQFWDQGRGWRTDLFTRYGRVMDRALNYVKAGLDSGEIKLSKTAGAMLWDQFQRDRAAAMKAQSERKT